MKHSLKFASNEELRQWFRENHMTCPGVWIRFDYNMSPASLSTEDALATALSFGWVDDRIKRINDGSYRKKFIPRREGSLWTDTQKELVSDLTDRGLMEKSGLDAVTRAKLDGSWNTSEETPATDAQLETFSAALQPYEPAFSNFLRLPPSSQRAHAVHYCSAKRPDTRARRLAAIVEKLNAKTAARGTK